MQARTVPEESQRSGGEFGPQRRGLLETHMLGNLE
jgi:hypothetical protein